MVKKARSSKEAKTKLDEAPTEAPENTIVKANENAEIQKPKTKKPRSEAQKKAFEAMLERNKTRRAQKKEIDIAGNEVDVSGANEVIPITKKGKYVQVPRLKKEKKVRFEREDSSSDEVEYVKKPRRRKKKKIVLEQDSSSDDEIVISRRRRSKPVKECPPRPATPPPALPKEPEIPDEPEPVPEVQYTHKQLLQAFGL
tara:strand:- start:2140 stop:2736 length:597 start_codon:yes stop_codon:yes gene_type:complete